MKRDQWEARAMELLPQFPNPFEAVRLGICFTWFGNAGEQLCFPIGIMEHDPLIKALEVVSIAVAEDKATLVRDNFGLEPHRIARLLPLKVKDYKPIWFANWEADNTDILIDGAHRYVAAWHKRAAWITAIKIPEPVWRPYVLEDMPVEDRDTVVNSFSGIF